MSFRKRVDGITVGALFFSSLVSQSCGAVYGENEPNVGIAPNEEVSAQTGILKVVEKFIVNVFTRSFYFWWYKKSLADRVKNLIDNSEIFEKRFVAAGKIDIKKKAASLKEGLVQNLKELSDVLNIKTSLECTDLNEENIEDFLKKARERITAEAEKIKNKGLYKQINDWLCTYELYEHFENLKLILSGKTYVVYFKGVLEVESTYRRNREDILDSFKKYVADNKKQLEYLIDVVSKASEKNGPIFKEKCSKIFKEGNSFSSERDIEDFIKYDLHLDLFVDYLGYIVRKKLEMPEASFLRFNHEALSETVRCCRSWKEIIDSVPELSERIKKLGATAKEYFSLLKSADHLKYEDIETTCFSGELKLLKKNFERLYSFSNDLQKNSFYFSGNDVYMLRGEEIASLEGFLEGQVAQ